MNAERQPITIDDAIAHRVPSEPQISPDGDWIVLSLGWASKTGEHPVADLWLAATDGRVVRRLIVGESNDVNPRWSPDGAMIAFISDRDERGTGALYLISTAGGEAVRLSGGDAKLAKPQWSPDSDRIAVVVTDPKSDDEKQREERRDDVIVHGEREKLDRLCVVSVPAHPFDLDIERVEPRRVIEGDWHVWEYAWSPDGTQIAVTIAEYPGWDETFDRLHLALVPADGGQLSCIGGDTPDFRIHPILRPTSLAWSPSGDRLAFLAAFDARRDAGEALYLLNVVTGTVEQRFNDEEGTLLGVVWPRDETLVTLRLRGAHTAIWELPVDGGASVMVTGAPLDERGSVSVGWQSPSIAGTIDRSGSCYGVVWSDATNPPEI